MLPVHDSIPVLIRFPSFRQPDAVWLSLGFHVSYCRYTYGMVSAPNVLTNANGASATISLDPTTTSFNLTSFYASPVYVDTLNLTLSGTTVDGTKLAASFEIVNPERTLVSPWFPLPDNTVNDQLYISI